MVKPLLQHAQQVLPSGSPLAIANGSISGQGGENKFGRTENADNGVLTDIWSRANAVDNQPIWLSPTAPRIHTIASDSAADVAGGSGTSSVLVYFLPDWDTVETTEKVTGNLNTGKAMASAAVIIHRIESIPQASSVTPNAGKITATAATDGTVTAQVEVGRGQTEMAIYGIPSVQTGFVARIHGNEIAAAGGNEAEIRLLFNPNPDIQTLAFLRKYTLGLRGAGVSALNIHFTCWKKCPGPGILKAQVLTDADDMDIFASFDVVIKDN